MQVKAIVNAAQLEQGQGAPIGERLRAAREAAGLSIEDAAVQIGLRRRAMQQAEEGRLPCVLKFRDMLQLYGVSSHYILTGQEQCEMSAEQAAELQGLTRLGTVGLRTKVSVLVSLFASQPIDTVRRLPAVNLLPSA
jgi:transcriptional regulator with XRE-family HTH domain